jgi:hypothetical protein
MKISDDRPYTTFGVHNVGSIWMTVTNFGQFGNGPRGSSPDPITGLPSPSCTFPAGSNINYLYVGAFWIGAIVGRDTIVSVGIDDYYDVQEFYPSPYPEGDIILRSIKSSDPEQIRTAKSEQDIVCIYTDTLTNPSYVSIDQNDGRPHIPLGIEVTQRSYAWSYSYAEDFILFDYSIKNLSRRTLEKVYMAVYVDGDVHHESRFGPGGYGEDNCGFRRSFQSLDGCGFIDTINVAYIMDNDGDPNEDQTAFDMLSATGLAGVRVVRTPSDSLKYSFNWWATDYGSAANDFGPRQIGDASDPFRDMDGVLGTPLGDRNKYYVMYHEEFDYDQLFTGKDHTDQGWLPRPPNANNIANGYDARYLLSFGPFNIHPGEILPVSFAWICAENIHKNAGDFADYYRPALPEEYYNKLDFSDLARNSMWASWIYDNPGIDTDSDGDSGKARICVYDSALVEGVWTPTFAETLFYEGDGVPDFKGASPPPNPELWLIEPYPFGDTVRVMITPEINEYNAGDVTIQWYGYRCETTRDVFSNSYDFEGYRVWISTSPNPEDFILMDSYDKMDYNRYVYNVSKNEWELREEPFTIDSLKTLYGQNFDPDYHNRDNIFTWLDSAFYFQPQDWNNSYLEDTLHIYKAYPNQPYPRTLNHDTAVVHYPEDLTNDGYFKYFIYRYKVRNLLPSRKYYFAVTAFDYGSPGHGLASLETNPANNMIAEYPQNTTELVESRHLNVVVYPNPYRADAQYRELGFEGQGLEYLPVERIRALHFTNLPYKCKIRIFTLDGDLVREIDHNYEPGQPGSMHETWDLITRNTQAVVSGIYYYSVDSEMGSQIGKIVIIM